MKGDSADKVFTPTEREQIRLAVTAAEAATSGEIATMVVSRSDNYREAMILGAVLGASMAALVIAVASRHVTIWTYLPITILLFYPAYWLCARFSQLQRPFIGSRRSHEAVQTRAVRAFYEMGLYRTRHETGILIFISLFERKVWILGDRGINARIPPESWQQLVQTLTAGLREGRACEALCAVIGNCGEVLARHFPHESDDSNELLNEVLGEQKL